MPFHKGEYVKTADDLRHLALFAKVENHDLERIAELGEEVDVDPGAVLVDQGDVGTECFLILEGEASVRVAGEHVATLGPGSILGEMALLGHRPRNASVIASTPMRALAFDIARFQRLLDELPAARSYVYELLEARAAENQS